MIFSKKSKIGVLIIALIIGFATSMFAQCGFVANQYTGCPGFVLDVQDTTTGSGQTANWTITLPPGSVPPVLYTYNNSQSSNIMANSGTVCVTMTDTINGHPCTATSCNVVVYSKPTIHGSFSTNVTCVGDCVYWNDASTWGSGCADSVYLLDWGQSPIDPLPGLCRKYTLNGVFSPSIVMVNTCGCKADTTFSQAITVTAPPSAVFSGTPLNSCASPLVSTMTAATAVANTKYYWYITPNGSPFGNVPSQANGSTIFVHSYTTGTWDIKLVAIDTLSGCSDSTVQTAYVTVGSNAAACFTTSDTAGCDQIAINFCPCTNGAIKYVWNFTGGGAGAFTPTTATSTTPVCQSVFYNLPGVYSAQLIVYYPGGCTDTLTRSNYIKLDNRTNLNFISPDSSTCLLPATIPVTYTGDPCPGCTFSWNPMPNTTPASTTGTSYTITSYGVYTPILTVTSPNGCVVSLIRNNYITVEPLQACTQKHYANGNGCANDTINVINCSQGGPFASVTWSFPGANVISQTNGQASVSYPGVGCNHYTMIVKSQSGCIDTLRDSICIGAKPTVTISMTPHDLCYESICNLFTLSGVLSSDTPTTVTVWPEGISGTAPPFILSPLDSFKNCYMYPDYGNFAYCFLAKTVGCLGDTTCLRTAADSVHIFPPATKMSIQPICSNSDTVVFRNLSIGADSTVWHYRGIDYPNKPTFSAVLPQCGTKYAISLTGFAATDTAPGMLAIDTVYCTLTISDTVSRPCYGVDFKFDKTTGCYYAYDTSANILIAPGSLVPTSVEWSVQLTSNPPVFSAMAFDGDTIPRYPLYLAGQYDACVRLTYNNGCIDTLCKPKYIDLSQPLASFALSDSAGCVPFCVQFTNTSIVNSGAIAHFYWNFGDTAGRVDSIHANPNHCFDTVGQFQVCLTIVDTNGCSSTFCQQIQANSIHANFTESDSITCVTNPSPLNPITYINTSTGFVSSFTWILPSSLNPVPAVAGNAPSITEQYGMQGYDSIGMVAIDQFGTCRDTVWKPVHVINPIANYGLPNLHDTFFICPPAVINPFIDSSQNNICGWAWNYGDGTPEDTARNPSHIWTIPGSYPVTEIVTSCHGCVDSITKYHITIGGPYVSMTATKTGGCPCLPVSFIIKSYNADALQVTSGGGIPLFTNISVFPRGTATNPTYDTVSFLYCRVGDVRPSVVAIDSSNNCNVFYDSLIVPIPVDTPTANFSARISPCGVDSVCFTNLTTYGATYAHSGSFLWNFGDGTTDNSTNPCHLYAAPGDYTISLRAIDNYGCGDSITRKIHVPGRPVAAFTIDDSIGCTPLLVHFLDSSVVDDSTSIVSGYWNFGDGTVANTTADTSHIYTVSNTYTATLVITDGYGCTDSAKHVILVQPPPTIAVGPNPTICLGDTATLSGSGSSTLLWLTNYNIDNTSSANPRVWPRVDTTYILRVGARALCYVYDTVHVFVSTIAISLDTATNLCRNQATSFSASAQTVHATISNYSWTFGDGTPGSNGQSVTHQYRTFGNYSDTLIVTNSVGCKDTNISPIQIFDIPNAALSISADSVCLGAPVTVTNLSTAGASAPLSTFYFDMQPDGTPDFTTSPVTYTYPTAGSYSVLLVQTDGNHCLDSAVKPIMVHALPHANFNNDTSCINVRNEYISSGVIGDGPINFYNWSINGISQNADSSTLYRTFANSGLYNICLNVADVYGCTDTVCKNVMIFSLPLDTVSPLDTTICAGYSASFNITGVRFDHVQWVPSTWVSNPTGTSVVITPKQTIRYQVFAYYLQCVPKVDTVTIWVIDSVPVSATADPENIVLGLSSNVTSTVQGTIDSIVWDPDSTLNCRNCRNPIATPHQTTTYTATVYYSKNGVTCSNRTSVTITVYQSCNNSLIYVPNTFTPNGDGKNDAFRLRGMGISKVNYFRVFDRWGKLVYEADNVDDPDFAAWNGGLHNDLNRPENSGVYVYVFEIQCITGQTVTGKGNVTLIR